MSRRYGRNQKRAHRAEIARLSVELATARGVADSSKSAARAAIEAYSRLKNDVVEWDEEITHLLGPQSAFRFDVARFRSQYPIFEVAIQDQLDSSVRTIGEFSPLTEVRMSRVTMSRYVLAIREDRERYQLYIRFGEENRDGKVVAYSLSRQLLDQRGFGRRDVMYLAARIADEMLEHLNGGKARLR